jgi:hypothetical protein
MRQHRRGEPTTPSLPEDSMASTPLRILSGPAAATPDPRPTVDPWTTPPPDCLHRMQRRINGVVVAAVYEDHMGWRWRARKHDDSKTVGRSFPAPSYAEALALADAALVELGYRLDGPSAIRVAYFGPGEPVAVEEVAEPVAPRPVASLVKDVEILTVNFVRLGDKDRLEVLRTVYDLRQAQTER